MLHGGGMLYVTILSLLAPLASAGVKGFGIIFSVEPMKGSLGGGTELHIAGAGFAYVTQVLVGGKPCHILEQMTKDGELTAFTPALPQGKHDVEVVFTSGHRAKLRDGQFQTHSRYTPVVNTISQAASVISNVTWRGDLKKMLEVGMNEIFRDTGEKRNATEIMHAYLGTGIEILSDKAGRDEFRCDILETPTETEGVCEVSAGTPAGYYNFTYVLQDGVSMNGYGKSVWEVQGLPYVSMDGQEYAIEVYPTIHSLRTKQVGRMGGAPVYVEADGIFVGKADFAARHQVTLDGVPCMVEEIENLGNTQALATTSRPESSRWLGMTSLTAMPLMYIAANKGLSGSRAGKSLRRSTAAPEDVRGEVTGVVLPVLAALAGWLAIMYGIQHSLISVPFLTGNQYEYFPIIATFVAGYAVIVLEEQTEINKAATALVLGVLVWALVGTGVDMSAANFDIAIKETLEDVSEVVFFLLGALTIVEIMDAHKGFDIITKAIQAKTQKELLIIIGVLTFVLSSVLNNLTVVIVMISLLQKLVKDEDFRMKLGGLVVVASNAGGAWTPIGDITTTMLYIGGQVTTVPLLANLFVPSVLCLVGTLGYEYIQMEDKPFDRDAASTEDDDVPNGQAVVFWGGLFGMITVPVFTALTQCPAWSGMMLVLGLLGLITSLLHGPEDEKYSLKGALTRVEVPDALFFLGVLFAVGGLERVGLLKEFAVQLSALVPYDALVAIFLGFASAIVDNVPLVAAAQGMYDLGQHPSNDGLWNLITYCAATGGSLLVIGSAAGVAFMGMERKVSFGWYVKSIGPAALAGYFLGVAGVLGQQALGLSVA